MSNNIFYKALAAVSTVGIVAIAGIQLTTALKTGNNVDDQLSKTMVEIKNARKDALAEVKSMRSDVLKELKFLQSNSLKDLEKEQKNALAAVRDVRKEVLSELKSMTPQGTSSSWWLVLVARNGGIWDGSQTSAAWALPMKDETQCEAAGLKVQGDQNFHGKVYQHLRYTCVKGK
tara:strand:- start:832 stop:1356 length:525 start_codon:yes stop_codon:yes gene_type:complete